MKFFLCSILILSVVLPLCGQESLEPELPFDLPDSQIRPLRKLVDKSLQSRLEKQLKQNKAWAKLIDRRRMAVGLVDLSDPYHVKFARVNGNIMMYAASLPKLAVLLAAFQSMEDGSLQETPDIKHDLKIMISQSDNQAATRMIDRVGFKKIETVLRDPRYELYDPNWGGGLWVGKRYAKGGKRYPDPVLGTSHGATVSQVCRFYYLLAFGKLVNAQRSEEMLDILVEPEIHHKFVYSLDKIVPDAKVYRKSGSWRIWHSDSVLVWGPVWRRYIVVALVEDASGEQILRNLVPTVEKVLTLK
jgi:beta-lactamase class A